MKITQDWMDPLSLAVQGVLTLALRGPDGAPKECDAKVLARAMRAVVLKGAHFKGNDDFMGDHSGFCRPDEVIERFAESHDEYPHHWLMHMIHAAEIIGYLHYSEQVRTFWHKFYIRMVVAFHMQPETKEQMLWRLREKNSPHANMDIAPCPNCDHYMALHDPEVGTCTTCSTLRHVYGLLPGRCLSVKDQQIYKERAMSHEVRTATR